MSTKLLTFTEKGIYCEQANIYIDPWKPVDYALITHAHSDHSRPGSKRYLATPLSKPIMEHRLGKGHKIKAIEYGETITINGVKISYHPAGHILGSAQIRLEYKGEIWVVSGDYKVANDGISEPFEPVKCHHFITESTFGLPIYNWIPQDTVASQMNDWWQQNKAAGKVSMMSAYSLGKAQRVLKMLDLSIGPIYLHNAVHNINQKFIEKGIDLPDLPALGEMPVKKMIPGAMIIGPTAILDANWAKRVKNLVTASASGWMAVRGIRRRRSVDKGFVLSDHADWGGLLVAIKATEAENIYVTHGYTDVFSKYLNENGWNASIVKTEFEGDEAN